MMCETMANVPVEEKSAYVLTEDMIDAAMNEQFAYQEDLESEEEESLPEENADHNSQESCGAENERTVENNVSTTNPTINIKSNVNTNTNPVMNISPSTSPNSSNNEVSVLVIETGLDKNGTDFIKTVKENPIVKNSNESLNSATDVHNTTDSDSTMTVNHSISDSKADLTILKSILSDSSDREGIIDLCESEADDYSEEEDANETETIDDELSSVMETNLMAEIGITMNKKTDNRDAEKISENIAPRISVKNISQISAQVFNSLPQNGCDMSFPLPEAPVTKNKMNENQCMRNINFTQRNPSNNSNIPITAHNQSSGAIHINKIAVPHSRFVNSQGQRMKCVYVKSTSNLPFVINTPTQTTAANMNTNVKYVMTQPIQQVKKPVQMPAIAALKNLTKNIQPQTLLLKNNTKLLMAQKLQRPPVLQTQSSSRSNIKKDAPGTGPAYDAIKNSLIYSSSNKKTHVPPDIFPEYPTYKCLDCNDKFLFKSSLANHIERRTMNIRYWCPCCKHELHFYNKCSLWIHLRGHSAVRHFDPKHLTITPISKDMLQKGIVSSYFFKITDSNTSQSVGSQSFQKSTFLGSKATQTNSLGPNSADSKQKTVSIGISNMINNKITTVAGQSKSVCFQSGSSSEISRPTSSPVSNTLPSTKILPLLLPKPPNPVKTVALVRKKSLPIHEKEATARSTQTPPKSLIVFCNKLAPAPNAQQISVASPATPNAVSEAKPNVNSLPNAIDNNDTAMVIDDDVSIVPNNTEEEEIDVENVDGNVNNTAAETEKSLSDKGTKNTPNSSPSGSNKRTCSECKSYCVNISKHLNGSGRPVHVNLACKICNLILPSKCALKIHHRIHMKISPYKCPDCGKDFTSWDDLHAHLKFSCGHFAKCVRFICKGCKAHFPSQNGLAQHIVKNHGKDIFKCSLCPVAFYKKHSLIKHIETDHQNEKNKSRLGLDYKQCEMCPKKLLPEESYLVHAKEHSHTMIYGYKCSMCNIVYANKMAFIIHQIKEKKKRDQESMGKSEQSKTVHDEEPVEEPLQVSDSSSDYEDEPLIIRKYPEAEDGSLVTEKDPLSLDDWEYAQEQKVKEKTEELCIVCKKNSVILLPGIDRNRQSSCCKECVKPLDDDSSTELNKGSKKIGNSYLKSKNNRQNNPKSIYRSSSMDEVKKSVKKRRISDISLNSPFENDSIDLPADSPTRKKNRKKQKGKSASKAQTHIQGQVIRSRSLDEFSHKCSKCEFVTENREFFLEHISVHRNDPNTYQCLECGLSFVVLPSLERHLQMHHGIKDVRSYTENNKASLPQKSVPVEEDTQENQCRVCYEIFDCQSSLDKHFRIHGMAFMSRLSKSP